MPNDAKHEIDVLMNTIQQSKNEIENSKAEWEQKEPFGELCKGIRRRELFSGKRNKKVGEFAQAYF